jgi:enterochelin esterase-like enzyme
MDRISQVFFMFVVTLLPAFSQSEPQAVFPEVHPNRTVTFRFSAPNAKEVTVNREGAEPLAMQRDEQGMWSATTVPLEPDFYSYTIHIDGVDVMDPQNPLITPNLLNSANKIHVPGPPSSSWELNDVPHGVVHHHSYRSDVVGDERDFYVYTPPGYDSDAKTKYPAFYLLHGYSDGADAWTAVGRANVILDNLIAQGKAKPMIVVMPLGYGTPVMLKYAWKAWDHEEFRQKNFDKFSVALMTELIPKIRSAYRISDDQKNHAIAGLSMGGSESLLTGLKNLNYFAWVGSFSAGGMTEQFDQEFSGLDSNANKQLKLLWVACGTDDHLITINRKFREWLKTKGIEHKDIETPGAHTWMVWRRNLTEFASLLFR